MGDATSIANTGLRGVTVASTRISDVQGAAGKLIYRGYRIEELARQATFEETAYLLLYEKLPHAAELKGFRDELAARRTLPQGVVTALEALPHQAAPMDVLQAAVALLSATDDHLATRSRSASLDSATRLIALFPTIVAAWERIRHDQDPVAPAPNLSLAANFLYMLSGERPDEEVGRFFDVCLVLHAEHSFNASTFAARGVASTRAHMYASVAAGVGALSGELHGGANVRVMETLLKIKDPEQVEAFVEAELDAGRVIFGLGHAVYQVDDPRAAILIPMSRRMGERSGQPQWFEISQRLEAAGKRIFKQHKGIDIFVNVDFYSAALYYTMGIALDLYTPIFAMSRVAGWCAHVIEEQFGDAAPKPALYRPASDYVGDYCGPEECAFVPVDDR